MILNPYRFAGAALPTFGNASRLFDGTSDYLTVPDGSWIPTGAQTWACWIKIGTLGTDTFFNHNVGAGNQRSVNFITVASGAVEFVISQNGAATQKAGTGTSAVSAGTWYHVAGTFDPSTSLKLYIDGTLSVTNTTSIYSSVKDSTADIGIGANGLGQAPFDGKIADCRIYDADIGATAIADLAAGTDYQTNLVGWWLTDNDNLDDYSGNNRDASEGGGSSSTYDAEGPLD